MVPATVYGAVRVSASIPLTSQLIKVWANPMLAAVGRSSANKIRCIFSIIQSICRDSITESGKVYISSLFRKLLTVALVSLGD